jgi:hypothetical protein
MLMCSDFMNFTSLAEQLGGFVQPLPVFES